MMNFDSKVPFESNEEPTDEYERRKQYIETIVIFILTGILVSLLKRIFFGNQTEEKTDSSNDKKGELQNLEKKKNDSNKVLERDHGPQESAEAENNNPLPRDELPPEENSNESSADKKRE